MPKKLSCLPVATALPVLLCLHLLSPPIAVSADEDPPIPIPIVASAAESEAVEAHLDYLTEHALDEYGRLSTPMWLATIDIKTSRLPTPVSEQQQQDQHDAQDWATANFYLDQPSVVAALELGRRTGCKCYSDAVRSYHRAFIKAASASTASIGETSNRSARLRPISSNQRYHVIQDELVITATNKLRRGIHTPAWESFWSESPETTEQLIRSLAMDQVPSNRVEESSGANATSGDLASQAIAIDSLAWLATKSQDRDGSLRRLARQITSGASVQSEPVGALGSWVESLIRMGRSSSDSSFEKMAEAALRNWLEQHLDAESDRYLISPPELRQTQIGSAGGEPMLRQQYSIFQPHRETSLLHPLPLAEACLSLWEATRDPVFRQAAQRWTESLRESLPANEGRGANAEDYGRAIHFLIRASDLLQQPELRDLAQVVADEAMGHLYEPRMGMFRSRVGEDRCDAVDGPGFLLLALLYLDGADPTSESALHF